ncbi:MAG: ATP-binding cassette domain-containing protein [Kiritimatiellae bacterium]|nr:ATP-binding cassette domain-containing protein [Kiritimatiellia bacterium]
MGPNGSGKSLLAAILADELPPRGVSITWRADVEGRVAMMSFSQQREQASTSWLQSRWHDLEEVEERRVADFLSYESVNGINPFEIREGDGAERRAFAARRKRWIARFRLGALLNHRLPQLSNGETRRFLLARTLLKDPKLLVLDDPFAGLDGAMREDLRSILNGLAAEGLGMVLMVRDESEIPACATHLLRLKALRFQRKGPLPERVGRGGGAACWPITPQPVDPCRPPVVAFRKLTIRYGRRFLFDGLDWVVRQGERWLVVGPNGSGKTTLLSLITGDNPRAYGADLEVFGQAREPGGSLWAIRSRIGQVSPEIQCYFDGRVTLPAALFAEVCDRYGKPLRMTAARLAAAERCLKELGISPARFGWRFDRLSAGEQRLVLLARALVTRPDLLLLDEPCLNLDAATRNRVLRVFEKVLADHPRMTVIYIAHRPGNVPRGLGHLLELGSDT